jgi:hypothetical protein
MDKNALRSSKPTPSTTNALARQPANTSRTEDRTPSPGHRSTRRRDTPRTGTDHPNPSPHRCIARRADAERGRRTPVHATSGYTADRNGPPQPLAAQVHSQASRRHARQHQRGRRTPVHATSGSPQSAGSAPRPLATPVRSPAGSGNPASGREKKTAPAGRANTPSSPQQPRERRRKAPGAPRDGPQTSSSRSNGWKFPDDTEACGGYHSWWTLPLPPALSPRPRRAYNN